MLAVFKTNHTIKWISVVMLIVFNSFAVIEFDPVGAVPGTKMGATRVRLEAGPNGDYHLAYVIPSATGWNSEWNQLQVNAGKVYYARYKNGKWSTPVEVGDGVPFWDLGVAGDSTGNGYVAFTNFERTHHYFATITNATEVDIEKTAETGCFEATVIFDKIGNIQYFVRTVAPGTAAITMRTKKPGETAWQTQVLPEGSNAGQKNPNFASDSKGNLYIAYRWMDGGSAERILAYQKYDINNSRWSGTNANTRFVGASKPWSPKVFVDKNDGMHILWGGGYDRDNNVSLAIRAPSGIITELDGGVVEYGWPATMFITDNGETIVVHSSMANIQDTAAHGEVMYLINKGSSWESNKDVDANTAIEAWGTVTGRGNEVMMAWVSEGEVKYSTSGFSIDTTDITATNEYRKKSVQLTNPLIRDSKSMYDIKGRVVPNTHTGWGIRTTPDKPQKKVLGLEE
ncbi:MAG: hypothetical protein HQK83_01555 [Fibrobacteria bacterium]|nr:hypothetical protein [Fibrobacteria bacterium]